MEAERSGGPGGTVIFDLIPVENLRLLHLLVSVGIKDLEGRNETETVPPDGPDGFSGGLRNFTVQFSLRHGCVLSMSTRNRESRRQQEAIDGVFVLGKNEAAIAQKR
jgi:hypothetical protein